MADNYVDDNSFGDFWKKAVPGMLDFGFGLYNRNAAEKEAADRLQRARGPLYDQATGAASGVLAQANSFNPDTFAADRFAKQQALLKPVQDAGFNDLLRTLYAKGQLGAGTYDLGLEGGTTGSGMLANPKIAAFFAAQNAQRSKDAYAALDSGQSYLDKLLGRANTLQGTANAAQNTGLAGERTQPSRAASNAQLFKGVTGILKDSGAMGGMLGKATDWLRGILAPQPSYPVMAGPGAGDSSPFPVYTPPPMMPAAVPSFSAPWAGNDYFENGNDWWA